ncbi:MAG TPA: HU family DNA-binding protein [Bacteroidales bacterium]|nr:HU family DNA-binding protein [Bacteroidales bacterium]
MHHTEERYLITALSHCMNIIGIKRIFNIFVIENRGLLDIKKHIKQLLIENQGVVIPGLGGFIAEYEPAAFDISENKFLPPTQKIHFNPKYSFSDKKLIDFIAQKEKIDKDKADLHLKEFVTQVKKQLKAGNHVDFPEIGTLHQNPKEEILFTRDKQSNLLAEAFGLKNLETKPIEQPVRKAVAIEKKSKAGKKLFIVLASATAFLLIIALSWYFTNGYKNFGFISSNKSIPKKNVEAKSPKTKASLDSIARADSIKAVINQTIDVTTNKKEALFYQEPEAEPEKEQQQFNQFHLIAGSFKKMENAEKFCSDLKAMGYEPEIIESEKNLLRIAIYSYPDEISALKKLYRLRETSEIKSVWILKTL